MARNSGLPKRLKNSIRRAVAGRRGGPVKPRHDIGELMTERCGELKGAALMR
jgi:hypothetical protein